MWPWMKNELMESSWLDGCTDMGIFLKMVLPIVKPALFTLSIIAFLQSWNSYLLPMIMINDPKMFTIPLGHCFHRKYVCGRLWSENPGGSRRNPSNYDYFHDIFKTDHGRFGFRGCKGVRL